MDIYLNDFHLHSTSAWLPTKVNRPVEGLEGGAPRMVIYDNPGEAGQTVSNILGGSSIITLTGSIRTQSGGNDLERASDYEASRAAFLDAIRLQSINGRPAPMILRIVMPSGSEYQASVYLHDFKSNFEFPTFSTWILNLINPAGIISSTTSSIVTLTLPEDDGIVYDVVYPIVYGSGGGGSAIANNYGNTTAKPVITFYGPLDHPTISNETLGKFLSLNLNIPSGQRVVVRTATPSIMQGSIGDDPTDNRMGSRATGSSFFGIAAGPNQLRLRAQTFDVGSVTVEWHDAKERL